LTGCIPHFRQTLPTPTTMGKVPGVLSAWPHRLQVAWPLERCCNFG